MTTRNIVRYDPDDQRRTQEDRFEYCGPTERTTALQTVSRERRLIE